MKRDNRLHWPRFWGNDRACRAKFKSTQAEETPAQQATQDQDTALAAMNEWGPNI